MEKIACFHVFSPFSAYFSPHYIIVEKGLYCVRVLFSLTSLRMPFCPGKPLGDIQVRYSSQAASHSCVSSLAARDLSHDLPTASATGGCPTRPPEGTGVWPPRQGPYSLSLPSETCPQSLPPTTACFQRCGGGLRVSWSAARWVRAEPSVIILVPRLHSPAFYRTV